MEPEFFQNFLCFVGVGVVVGVPLFLVAMFKKASGMTGSSGFTRDGYHQEF